MSKPCEWCKETSEKIDSLEAENEQLRKALELAKTMFIANDMFIPKTMTVINKALKQ